MAIVKLILFLDTPFVLTGRVVLAFTTHALFSINRHEPIEESLPIDHVFEKKNNAVRMFQVHKVLTRNNMNTGVLEIIQCSCKDCNYNKVKTIGHRASLPNTTCGGKAFGKLDHRN